MASIKLRGLEKIKPHITVDDPTPRVSSDDEFTFKDIKLDLEFEQDSTNLPDGTTINTKDLKDLRDINDIKQALINILNTSPGQKLLNPFFGLNLSHYCFDPITRITADHIARTILVETPMQDSRINIKHLHVEGNIDENTYNIGFNITIPGSNTDVVNIKGILNSDGFTLSNL
tara:strand:- start:1571 stop:2092 length:522 start_codon:yes stop_codon:yes gene_type:complete